MNAARVVQDEILDALPAHDPRAQRSRRDLRRVNAWMGQSGIMARLLLRYGTAAPAEIVELGCGDGSFMLGVARTLAATWQGVRVRLIDRQDLVTSATIDSFATLGWIAEPVVADVFDVLSEGCRADIVVANLFLHHFETEDLRALLAGIAANARFVAACEPRRAVLAQLGSRMLFAIGCNDVTRHDAITSVQAGFSGNELSGLWLDGGGWDLREAPAGLFTHTFTGLETGVRA